MKCLMSLICIPNKNPANLLLVFQLRKYYVFKKKHNEQSYRTNYTNSNIVLYEKGIKLPKLGVVKCKYNKDKAV